MKHRQFGAKSEKMSVYYEQFSLLFDEAELIVEAEENLEQSRKVSDQSKAQPKKRGRKKLTEMNPDLEIREINHAMEELLDQGYDIIGHKQQETFRFIPAQFFIERHIYPVYRKEMADGCEDIRSLYQGNGFLSKSNASPEIVAAIMNDKYAKGLPLYRIEESFKNLGFNCSRQTMSNWLIHVAQRYGQPLIKHMKEDLLSQDIVHCDETTVKVLKHQDGSTNKTSYMWLYRSGEHADNILVYDYRPTRQHQWASAFLQGFSGYLQSDGYPAYQKVENTIQVGCLAHGRRQLKEAVDVMGKRSSGVTQSIGILKTMNRLFKEDQKLRLLDLEAKQTQRLQILGPLFDALHQQLTEASNQLLPKSVLGKAIQYNLNQWDSFQRVLLDPRLELSNNRRERGIKPFVMGRKAWLFSNTTKGAKESATIYSLVQSAKENGLQVERYLIYVFEMMSQRDDHEWTPALLSRLVPHSQHLPSELYTSKKQR